MTMPTSLVIPLTRALKTREEIICTVGKAREVVEARHRADLGTELSILTDRIRGPARQRVLVSYLRHMFAGLGCKVILVDIQSVSNLDENHVLRACEECFPAVNSMQGFDQLECPTK